MTSGATQEIYHGTPMDSVADSRMQGENPVDLSLLADKRHAVALG